MSHRQNCHSRRLINILYESRSLWKILACFQSEQTGCTYSCWTDIRSHFLRLWTCFLWRLLVNQSKLHSLDRLDTLSFSTAALFNILIHSMEAPLFWIDFVVIVLIRLCFRTFLILTSTASFLSLTEVLHLLRNLCTKQMAGTGLKKKWGNLLWILSAFAAKISLSVSLMMLRTRPHYITQLIQVIESTNCNITLISKP